MKDNETDWVAMQVPDGTDWVEYMLNVKPNADQHTMGVMNHISLGVKISSRHKPSWNHVAGSRTGTRKRKWDETESGS